IRFTILHTRYFVWVRTIVIFNFFVLFRFRFVYLLTLIVNSFNFCIMVIRTFIINFFVSIILVWLFVSFDNFYIVFAFCLFSSLLTYSVVIFLDINIISIFIYAHSST